MARVLDLFPNIGINMPNHTPNLNASIIYDTNMDILLLDTREVPIEFVRVSMFLQIETRDEGSEGLAVGMATVGEVFDDAEEGGEFVVGALEGLEWGGVDDWLGGGWGDAGG